MTNHPGRTIAAALKRILADHDQYKLASTEGRANIRRNISTRLHESADYAGEITADRLVAWYNLNGLTAGEGVKI